MEIYWIPTFILLSIFFLFFLLFSSPPNISISAQNEWDHFVSFDRWWFHFWTTSAAAAEKKWKISFIQPNIFSFFFFSFLYSSNTLKHEIRNSSFQSRVFKKMPSKRFLTIHSSPLLCSSRRRQYLLRLFYIFSYLAEKSETKRNACMFHSNAQLKSSFGWLLDCCLSWWSRVN